MVYYCRMSQYKNYPFTDQVIKCRLIITQSVIWIYNYVQCIIFTIIMISQTDNSSSSNFVHNFITFVHMLFGSNQRQLYSYQPDKACRSRQTWLSWRKHPFSFRWVKDLSYLISVVRASKPEEWNVFMLKFNFFTPYWVSESPQNSHSYYIVS
jgi:hypothetical protein